MPPLLQAVQRVMARYHPERNHKDRETDRGIPFASLPLNCPVKQRQRLGGIRNDDYREAD